MTTQTNEENLAQQAQEIFVQALEFYNNNDYQRALQFSQQLIGLYKQLPLENPDYKISLMGVYHFCGMILNNLKRFGEAIQSYQHAINLDKQLLFLNNPDHKNTSVTIYSSYGKMLFNLGRFKEAVSYFEQAIERYKQLPLDNSDYKNDLASVYNSCGLALYNLRSFEEAIEHYQHAIELGKQLPLDNPDYKNNLATAYSNYGNVLLDLRSFEKAIEYNQYAIDLFKQFSLDNPEYRRNLIGFYVNYGNALANLKRFEEAIEYYQHAINLRKQFSMKDNHQYYSFLGNAYNGFGRTLNILGRYTEAEEAIEESLNISRELEEQGIFLYREAREAYFENAIVIFINSSSFDFLPKLILEHLDPDNSGSAPQSEKMHKDALKILQILYRRAYYTYPELIEEIEETTEKLAEIRAKYFTGTVSGAKLTAQFYEENAKNFEKAEEILTQYTQKIPNDVEGYQQLGEFYERQKQNEWALICFEKSIKIALQQKTEESFIYHILQNAAYLAIDNKEFPNFMAFNATGIAFKQLNQMKEWFNTFVDSFEKTEKLFLKNLWKPISEELDNDYQTWLANYHSNMREQTEKEFYEKMKQKREAQRRSLHEVIRSLDKHLAVIVETLFNSFEQHWDKQDQAWEQANEEQRQAIETDIIQSLQNVIEQLAAKLSEEEKHFAFEELQRDLPFEIWEKLKQSEQDILLLAMRMKQKEIHQFASLGFGQLIEIALSKRLFYPIKSYVKQQDIEIIPNHNKDTVAYFFNGKLNHLMLGSMVGAFNQAVHFDRTVTCQEVENLLLEGLKNFPKHHLLLAQSDKTKKTRAERLQRITKIRNNCAHPEQNMSLEETNEIYDNVIKDSEHAFCRYFIGACH